MIAENVGEIHGGLAGELHVDEVARIPIAVPLVGVASIGAQLGDAISTPCSYYNPVSCEV